MVAVVRQLLAEASVANKRMGLHFLYAQKIMARLGRRLTRGRSCRCSKQSAVGLQLVASGYKRTEIAVVGHSSDSATHSALFVRNALAECGAYEAAARAAVYGAGAKAGAPRHSAGVAPK